MTAAPRFSLRTAVTDSVSTGRRADLVPEPETASDAEPATGAEPSPEPIDAEPAPETALAARRRRTKPVEPARSKRAVTREGARGITVWVEPEVYRMVKLVWLDADMTTQAVMLEAIDDLLAKRGKGRITKTR